MMNEPGIRNHTTPVEQEERRNHDLAAHTLPHKMTQNVKNECLHESRSTQQQIASPC